MKKYTALFFAVAGALLLGGLTQAQAQKTSARLPDRTTILTTLNDETGRTLLKPCSRPAPEAVSFWTPTPSDVQVAEKGLPAFIQSLKQQGPRRRLRNDYRQYAGFIGKYQHKFLYVNGFSPGVKEETERAAKGQKKPFHWQRDPMIACDGGDLFWGAEYDTQTKQWSRFYFNGR